MIKKENEISIEMILEGINSHYLFDTLHSVKGYNLIDAEKANELINLLAKAARQGLHILKEGNALIPISTELEYIERYLEIAKVHYGDVQCELFMDSEDFLVPAFALRHLCEDAFMRSMSTTEEIRKVRLYTFSDFTHEYIEIKDNGVALEQMEIEKMLRDHPDQKRDEFRLYRKAGWEIEIISLPNEGNQILISRRREDI